MNISTGTFWVNENQRVTGRLEIDDDERFRLKLDQFMEMPRQVTREGDAFAYSTEPEHIVADYQPRTIHGKLADGTIVSLLGAHMEQGPTLSLHFQVYTGETRIVGEHIADDFAPVNGIRWAWNVALSDFGESAPSETVDGPLAGSLSFWEPEGQDGNQGGLAFTATQPVSLRDLRQYVQASSGQLIGLWGGRHRHRVPRPLVTELLVGDQWRSYIGPADGVGERIGTALLPLRELCLNTFAVWIPFARSIDPFPYMANADIPTLQVRAQVLATALEGIHNRLDSANKPFATVPKKSLTRARKAACEAGVGSLRDDGFTDIAFAEKRFMDSLGHVNDVTYYDRVFSLATAISQMAPGLCGPDLARWASMVMEIRNEQSHQSREEFQETNVSEYFVAVQTAQWVLSLRILRKLAKPNRLQAALKESNTFLFVLANIDAEGLWPGYSALQTFRDSVPNGETAEEPSTSA